MKTSNHGYFIGGTDTGIGKTWITSGLINRFNQLNQTTMAMKPIASGCIKTSEGWRNEDALLLKKAISEEMPYELINPFVYEPAIAPHIAASKSKRPISIGKIIKNANQLHKRCDSLFVEGIGGLAVPINEKDSTLNLIEALGLPLILVVGIKLGCINHALLSLSILNHYNINLCAWVANCIDNDTKEKNEIIHCLKQRIDAPLLGTVPFQKEMDAIKIGGFLNLDVLKINQTAQ